MNFVDAFRDTDAILEVAKQLHVEANGRQSLQRSYHFMEFCGGHTHVIFRFGLKDLLPKNLNLVHGPGCPVCVLPRGRIDSAIELVQQNSDVVLCTYADLMRVPGSHMNFIKARAMGADIRMVYSPDDALNIAKRHPNKKTVFLGIGFETTAPATAMSLINAQKQKIDNFLVYGLHLLTPPAVQHVLNSPEVRELGTVRLDGFIGPGHVCTVIGTRPFEGFCENYQKPVVVSGFDPLDMMQSILLLVRMVNENKYGVFNQYQRAVNRDGNLKAQDVLSRVFEVRTEFEWRGLGRVPNSSFKIRPEFEKHDAEVQFSIRDVAAKDHPACLCGSIIRGVKSPKECKLFGKVCTPESPMGPCMVSSEGSCAAHYSHRGGEQI